MSARRNADRRIVFWLFGVLFVIVALTAIAAPATADDDPAPTTFNSGSHGAKGAYLLLTALGYQVARSDATLVTTLDAADAPHTTFIIAGSNSPGEEAEARERAAVQRFLQRGGRVFASGVQSAIFVPDGRAGAPTRFLGDLCTTTAEGPGQLAQAGTFSTYDGGAWASPDPTFRVDARCGADAVLVHRPYPNGGLVMWSSSSEPITNRGLRNDNSLHLLLTAVGPAGGPLARHVIFDEYYHGTQASPSDYLSGLPLRSLIVQATLVVLLLLFTYTRRSGPVREPLLLPRTSPVEFATNMGALYERAHATQPSVEAARRRTLQFFIQVCGVPADVANGPAAAAAQVVGERFSVNTAHLALLLERAESARYEKLRPRDALNLVRGLDEEKQRVSNAINPAPTQQAQETA